MPRRFGGDLPHDSLNPTGTPERRTLSRRTRARTPKPGQQLTDQLVVAVPPKRRSHMVEQILDQAPGGPRPAEAEIDQ